MISLPNIKKPCADCPFRKDTQKGWLGASRMTEIVEQPSFVCHKKQHLQCAGHMLINGVDNQFVQLAKRLSIKLSLTGRELVFETKEACVSHHSEK
ncbi:hypothetical protein L3081_24955 [Colwellia sp. MSW7]|uniref:Uncharacterized protein n=1 Tax=Colwellia maritima TaxID=2912588 RepID=A0ABS9X757_9GAMM|nr:hypothetical protein [Colwellia maritima]MCI2286075.1 hypothetical protein [Colwellia maritima]